MDEFDLPDNDEVNFQLESFELPNNDEVDFVPVEEDEEGEPFDIGVEPIDLTVEPISLPVHPLNLKQMEVGLSVFLMGLLALLLGAATFLKNYAAGIMWAFAVFALIISGLLGIGLELFWAMVAATVLLLIMGMIVRWMA